MRKTNWKWRVGVVRSSSQTGFVVSRGTVIYNVIHPSIDSAMKWIKLETEHRLRAI